MNCPTCGCTAPCRMRLSVGKRGPAFAPKVIPSATLPGWAFVVNDGNLTKGAR